MAPTTFNSAVAGVARLIPAGPVLSVNEYTYRDLPTGSTVHTPAGAVLSVNEYTSRDLPTGSTIHTPAGTVLSVNDYKYRDLPAGSTIHTPPFPYTLPPVAGIRQVLEAQEKKAQEGKGDLVCVNCNSITIIIIF